MSDYWNAFQKFLSEYRPGCSTAPELVRDMISHGYTPAAKQDDLLLELNNHWGMYAEDGSSEYDYYCDCGKWLEYDQYDWEDHVSSTLSDLGLVTPKARER
ncbi:hypothetical protein BKG82_24825 [Mycobacteroides chelonae]|uniref:Uncharacterized protein n=1 Tax=Mycobacteroides chelonae TaxID=1774 RepID=A0A1S1LHE4_MYCCH|nr:hypothetical protein [Mycobacteroides chelonae]OHU47597.1 hypothetical protein BKG82_24825 [Mycobacteroides chelonae]